MIMRRDILEETTSRMTLNTIDTIEPIAFNVPIKPPSYDSCITIDPLPQHQL